LEVSSCVGRHFLWNKRRRSRYPDTLRSTANIAVPRNSTRRGTSRLRGLYTAFEFLFEPRITFSSLAWLPPMLLNEIRECTKKSRNFAAARRTMPQVRGFIFNPRLGQPVSSRLMIVSERSYFMGGSIERPRIGRQSIYNATPDRS